MADLHTPDWLVTHAYTELHHATLTREQAQQCEDDGGIYEPVILDCGKTALTVHIPGLFSRNGLPRCKRCCKATGLPEGDGSPKNDPECRRILGLDPS